MDGLILKLKHLVEQVIKENIWWCLFSDRTLHRPSVINHLSSWEGVSHPTLQTAATGFNQLQLISDTLQLQHCCSAFKETDVHCVVVLEPSEQTGGIGSHSFIHAQNQHVFSFVCYSLSCVVVWVQNKVDRFQCCRPVERLLGFYSEKWPKVKLIMLKTPLFVDFLFYYY